MSTTDARRLLIATTNPGKLREIRRALEGVPFHLLSLDDVQRLEEPEENGATFAENALLKAHFYCSRTGLLTTADDSGLSIDALDGRPGVESARYPGATYPEKFANLYRELNSHTRPWRARFVCAVALVSPGNDAPMFTAEAAVEGEVIDAPRGTNGFGYDPIFFYRPYSRTLGQVSDAEKLAVSHRGQAFQRLREWLRLNPAAG
jgi:XTP/dITP diphosphohydrolase